MDPLVDDAAKCIAEAVPEGSRLILFGSRARGDARTDSDLDLLVIEPEVPDRGAETGAFWGRAFWGQSRFLTKLMGRNSNCLPVAWRQ